MLVRFKLFIFYIIYYKPKQFQFYVSAIQTFCGLKNFFGQAYVSILCQCDSNSLREGNFKEKISFNSMLVRFKLFRTLFEKVSTFCFNSMLVRFKPDAAFCGDTSLFSFNSMLVRFKLANYIVATLQTPCFNSMLVRFKLWPQV